MLKAPSFSQSVFTALLLSVTCFESPAVEPNPLLSPKEAVERMTLPKGFSVDILAAEPQLVQPIAFCWDEHGRLWVVEGNTYPQRAGNPPAPAPDSTPTLDQLTAEERSSLFGGSDRIVIFSDKDGDGVYETREVFIEGLNLVSGIEVGFGGVFVGAAPFLVHIPIDASGSKPGGAPRVLADGFGWQDTHETLNSFIWGPDGWLYGCHGVFTQSKVRVRTGQVTGPRPVTPMNCAYWRWHPVREEFELFAQGTSNPWGLDYNSKGQFFSEACVIPHFWHVIQGAYYLRQSNPLGHFNPFVYRNIETIADHAHYVGSTHGTPHELSNESGGGHAHCGLLVYESTHFPAQYKGHPLFGNIHGKRINQDRLIPEGSGYRASHAPDFLQSNDYNFTAVTLKTAPDGSVVFSDWYDKQKCHNRQSEIWDRTNGRLYRVRHEGWKPWKESPGLWSPASTLELQLQENAWLSRMARLKAAEQGAAIRADKALVQKAIAIVESGTEADTALRVLWWLRCAGVDYKLNSKAHRYDDPYVRLWDIQLNAERINSAPVSELQSYAISDPSPVVRLGVASALQRIPTQDRWNIVDALLQHAEDNADHNLPQMAWFAIEPAVPEAPERAIALAKNSKLGLPAELIARRLAEMQTTEARSLLVRASSEAETAAEALRFVAPLAEALKGRFQIEAPSGWSETYTRLQKFIDSPNASDAASLLKDARTAIAASFGDARAFPELRDLAKTTTASLPRRQQALQTLASAKAPGFAELLLELLSDSNLRLDALRQSTTLAVAEPNSDSAPARFVRAVLERYTTFSADEKSAAVLALAGRASTARQLLDAVASKQIPRGDLSSFVARQIAGLKDPSLSQTLEKVWGTVRSGDADSMAKTAAEEHARFKAILTPNFLKGANLPQGRELFKNSCGQCHQLFGQGGKIGPDLTGSNRADVDYLLENVTNPSAIIGKDYELHIFTLKDGRIVSGMVRQENDIAVTVQSLAGEEQVRRSDIAKEDKPAISMMPAGLFSGLTKEQMRDLTAYLASPRQVPLPGEPEPGVFKAEGAIEGEGLRVLSPTQKAAPQKMRTFREGNWSGEAQLFWTGGKPGDVLKLALPVAKAGKYRLKAVLTRAPDYAIVRFALDGKLLEQTQTDLFGSKVTNTQPLPLTERELSQGEHELSVEITGSNPSARPSYMFGLDYLLLEPLPAN